MNEAIRNALLERNRLLTEMVVERIRRDFSDDIPLVAVAGSFVTGDYHEKSDLDLILVNDTERGWDILFQFILDDVGFDVYCTPWEPRLGEEARLENPMTASLMHAQVVHCGKPEALARLEALQREASERLSKPVGPECLARAEQWISRARESFDRMQAASTIGTTRHEAGRTADLLMTAISHQNNAYFRLGVKRHLDEIRSWPHRPDNFERLMSELVEAASPDELRSAAASLLSATAALQTRLAEQTGAAFGSAGSGNSVDSRSFDPSSSDPSSSDPFSFDSSTAGAAAEKPDAARMRGTFEELWSNYRHKLLNACEERDGFGLFMATCHAQDYLDEMRDDLGMPWADLTGTFDVERPDRVRDAYLSVLDAYLDEYRRVGLAPNRYASIDEVRAAFLRE